MTSNEIYILVCKLYFKTDLTIDEIYDHVGSPLIYYKHEKYTGIVGFDNWKHAIETIIKSEIHSQLKAKQFR